MTGQDDKINATLALAEKVGLELVNIAPQDLLEINLLNLTMMQLKVVIFLSLDKQANMSALAERLNLGLSTVTGIVDRLVKLKIVVRKNISGDRRVVICRLTEKGGAMIDNAWKLVLAQFRNLLKEIPEEKLPMIDEVMQLLLAGARSSNRKVLADKSDNVQ